MAKSRELFADRRLEDHISDLIVRICNLVRDAKKSYIFNTQKRTKFYKEIIERYKIEILKIDESQIRKTSNYDDKMYFYIPFEGNKNLFRLQPFYHPFNYPWGSIEGNTIKVPVGLYLNAPEKMKNEFRQQLERIKKNIEETNRIVSNFNNKIIKEVFQAEVEKRKRESERRKNIDDIIEKIQV